jgi:hypothetical protein
MSKNKLFGGLNLKDIAGQVKERGEARRSSRRRHSRSWPRRSWR